MQLAQKYWWLFMNKLMMLKKNYADFIVLAKCASLNNRALKYLACLLFTIKKSQHESLCKSQYLF